MPVLHKYKDRNNYYILTAIKGNIITFQLAGDGYTKLIDAGIKPDEPFGRALLLDLVRSGDAYTQGTGPGIIDSDHDHRQLQFDFPEDPEPESMIPSCSNCSSLDDLHLVEIITKDAESRVSILCPKCRYDEAKKTDTSVPLFLVSRGLLKRLLEKKAINKLDDSVRSYNELLDIEFDKKWEAVSRSKLTQGNLFEMDQGDQKSLF